MVNVEKNKGKTWSVDVVGVGMPRCGTTWLSRCLREHPQICFSKDKETHFFDIEWGHTKVSDFQKKQFSHCKNENKAIEFTTTYFESEEVLKRIKNTFPRVKVLFVMRNPYDRAFSHYLYRKRKNGYPHTFSSLFVDDLHHVLDRSLYAKYLSRVWSVFGKENVIVLNHDDSGKDQLAYIQNVYKQLGVDESFTPPSLSVQVNKSKNLHYMVPFFEHIFTYRMRMRKSCIGRRLIYVLKKTHIHNVLVWLRHKNMTSCEHKETEYMSQSDKEKMEKYLREDIKELEKMLGKSFSHWKRQGVYFCHP